MNSLAHPWSVSDLCAASLVVLENPPHQLTLLHRQAVPDGQLLGATPWFTTFTVQYLKTR